MESLKILITGATGFIGANVAIHLAKEDHEIYGLSRNGEYNWRLEDERDKIRLVKSDISSYERTYSAIEYIKPDGIIHCSQYGAYPKEKSNKLMFQINNVGLFNILDICTKFNVNWLINCGTSFEYDGSKESIRETTISNPHSYYGLFKANGTKMLDLYSNLIDTKLMTLRIFQAYGPFEPKGRLVPYLLYNLINNLDVHLNNPYLERDFTYIKDITTAFSNSIKVMDNLEKHEIINVGSGTHTSIQNFANTGKNVINSSSRIVLDNFQTKPEDRINRIFADITKAKTILKWNPKFQVSEGIKDFAIWLKDRLDYYKE
jgi:nucleoside-diphosphate-sugar epimerase